jgi:hypothetical protein
MGTEVERVQNLVLWNKFVAVLQCDMYKINYRLIILPTGVQFF